MDHGNPYTTHPFVTPGFVFIAIGRVCDDVTGPDGSIIYLWTVCSRTRRGKSGSGQGRCLNTSGYTLDLDGFESLKNQMTQRPGSQSTVRLLSWPKLGAEVDWFCFSVPAVNRVGSGPSLESPGGYQYPHVRDMRWTVRYPLDPGSRPSKSLEREGGKGVWSSPLK